jgi:hypothetical protein
MMGGAPLARRIRSRTIFLPYAYLVPLRVCNHYAPVGPFLTIFSITALYVV